MIEWFCRKQDRTLELVPPRINREMSNDKASSQGVLVKCEGMSQLHIKRENTPKEKLVDQDWTFR